jgi:hypothetical protein
MRRVAVVIGVVTIVSASTLIFAPKSGAQSQVRALLTRFGLMEDQPLPKPVTKPAAIPAPAAVVRKLDPMQRVRSAGGAVIYIPADCLQGAAKYDLLFHFHGAGDVVARGMKEADLYAVLAVVNVGTGGDTYARALVGRGMLDSLLAQVAQELKAKCTNVPERGRIALSGFSAGYGAVSALLKSDAARVDAVLLADGIHAGFDDVKRRHIEQNQLSAFVDFGKAAMRGEKLFSITHSAIQTPNYPSTTESTDFLLKKLGLTRTIDPHAKTSSVIASGFRLQSEPGMDAPAHMRHLYGMGNRLFLDLRDHWK